MDAQKLIWHSNAPWAPTGYAQQTALFLPRLNDHFNIACSAFYGLEGSVLPWRGIPVLPGIGVTHGNETILDHVGMFFDDPRDGIVFTLMDVWVLDPAIWRRLNVASWAPVDHRPVPMPVAEFFHDTGAVPIAMSRFGEEQLSEAGLNPLYVPHAVDCSVYKPHEGVREEIGFPPGFICGMFAANKGNPSRKSFVEALQAFKVFRERHPESMLYLHTEAKGRFDGIDLPFLVHELDLPSESVFFCDQYRAVHYPFDHETMAKLYSACDVLLMPSAGEGFGLPSIEAQACGTPVIGSAFSAQPETIGSGWLVKGTPTFTAIRSWQMRPDIEDITDALNRAYAMLSTKAGREEAAGKGREHAEKYDVERVFSEFMLPALGEIQSRFEAREPELVAA